MKREQIEELAALDALGALDGEDVAAWERVCAEDPEAARLRDAMAAAAAQLAWVDAPSAPEALRRRVMDAVFGAADPEVTPANRLFGWSAWAAAAGIVLLALAGTAGTTALRESVVVRDVRPEARTLYIPLNGYGDYAAAKGCVLWDSGQRGWYLQADGLPALPSSHRYRVWAIDADGAVHDCGELPLSAGGAARRFVQPGDGIDSMQGFALTVEPAGTSPEAPSTPAVLISPALQG
jgi:anti-sigma-K factor RskA